MQISKYVISRTTDGSRNQLRSNFAAFTNLFVFLRAFTKGLATAAAICIVFFTYASAAVSDEAESCLVKADSGTIVILVCNEGLAEEQIADFAKGICTDRNYCNAWVWTNTDHAPETAPAQDKDLSQNAIKHAIAVWANDSKSLLRINKAQ